jgi:hypothetical protein
MNRCIGTRADPCRTASPSRRLLGQVDRRVRSLHRPSRPPANGGDHLRSPRHMCRRLKARSGVRERHPARPDLTKRARATDATPTPTTMRHPLCCRIEVSGSAPPRRRTCDDHSTRQEQSHVRHISIGDSYRPVRTPLSRRSCRLSAAANHADPGCDQRSIRRATAVRDKLRLNAKAATGSKTNDRDRTLARRRVRDLRRSGGHGDTFGGLASAADVPDVRTLDHYGWDQVPWRGDHAVPQHDNPDPAESAPQPPDPRRNRIDPFSHLRRCLGRGLTQVISVNGVIVPPRPRTGCVIRSSRAISGPCHCRVRSPHHRSRQLTSACPEPVRRFAHSHNVQPLQCQDQHLAGGERPAHPSAGR